MWKALAAYLAHNRKRYLFGCCSLSSQDAREGARASKMLAQGGHLHPTLFAPAQPGFECAADDRDEEGAVSIPRLFRTYLRFGARVCSPPAIDRVFKTIDFLVILDVNEIDYQTRKLFLGA
jgi:putative hemolysin